MSISKLEDVLSRVDIVRREIFEYLSVRDFHVLSVTCRRLRWLTVDQVKRSGEVDDKLKKFVKDPTSFRLMLRDMRAVLAGEFARKFFLGSCDVDNLDVVVVDPKFYSGYKMSRLVQYLGKREGYSLPAMRGPFWQRAVQVCFPVCHLEC